jgi:hypothetical protein
VTAIFFDLLVLASCYTLVEAGSPQPAFTGNDAMQAEMLYLKGKETVITLCANGSVDHYNTIVEELMSDIFALLEELQD